MLVAVFEYSGMNVIFGPTVRDFVKSPNIHLRFWMTRALAVCRRAEATPRCRSRILGLQREALTAEHYAEFLCDLEVKSDYLP